MKAYINAIIIGAAIVIAAVIVVLNLPRYQYGEYISTEKNGNIVTDTTEAYVFDMVTGKKYSHTHWALTIDNDPARVHHKFSSAKKPDHSILEVWAKQREIFGTEMIDVKEWKAWKDSHPEW